MVAITEAEQHRQRVAVTATTRSSVLRSFLNARVGIGIGEQLQHASSARVADVAERVRDVATRKGIVRTERCHERRDDVGRHLRQRADREHALLVVVLVANTAKQVRSRVLTVIARKLKHSALCAR